MTLSEMSQTFDILYNNSSSNQAPGLNEAEKSIYLTKAQNMLVKEQFNSRTDGVGGGFDGSQQRQYDFSSLIKIANLFNVNTYDKNRITDIQKLDKRSRVFLFPHDYFLTVNEVLSDSKRQYSVLPLSYDEYQRLMLKPYNFPVKRGAWRLITNKLNCNYINESANPTGTQTSKFSPKYELLTTGCDQGNRHLELLIHRDSSSDYESVAVGETFNVDLYGKVLAIPNKEDNSEDKVVINGARDSIHFLTRYKGIKVWRKITTALFETQSSATNDTYPIIEVHLSCPSSQDKDSMLDDYDIAELIKIGFKYAVEYLNIKKQWNQPWYLIKILKFMDAFRTFSAPKQVNNFGSGSDGDNSNKTFKASVIQLPVAEIIGKFENEPTYQLRYVKRPRPIILEDLTEYDDEFSIDGIYVKSECELPVETHQEIVERAVTLAKIAWQGGTVTQAAAAQASRQRNDDN